jgi:hypothetical protein
VSGSYNLLWENELSSHKKKIFLLDTLCLFCLFEFFFFFLSVLIKTTSHSFSICTSWNWQIFSITIILLSYTMSSAWSLKLHVLLINVQFDLFLMNLQSSWTIFSHEWKKYCFEQIYKYLKWCLSLYHFYYHICLSLYFFMTAIIHYNEVININLVLLKETVPLLRWGTNFSLQYLLRRNKNTHKYTFDIHTHLFHPMTLTLPLK